MAAAKYPPCCIVIPARSGSSRFSGKMLAEVAGRTVLARTVAIARAVPNCDEVVVATNDVQIKAHAEGLGVRVASTPDSCRNGTERILAAAQALRLPHELFVNLQGDAVLTPPWVVEMLIETLRERRDTQVATPVLRLTGAQYSYYQKAKAHGRASGTLVVRGQDGHALYFSKAIIPHLRDPAQASPPVWRHIGCYGYRASALEHYVRLSATPLEEAEQLEQLRFLEHGVPILTVPVDYRGRTHGSIDYPEDIAEVADIISREGELAPAARKD